MIFSRKIVDKFIKLSKIGFSVEYFTGDFSQFSSVFLRICLVGGRLGTRYQTSLKFTTFRQLNESLKLFSES